MTFTTDGKTNLVAGAMPVALPGMPGVPGMPMGMLPGGGVRPGVPQPMNTGLPVSTARPGTTPPTVYTPGTLSPNAPVTPSVRPIPSRQVRTTPTVGGGIDGVNTGGAPAQPQHNLSPEQQVLLMEAQRMVNPTLPPTPGIPPPLPGAPQ